MIKIVKTADAAFLKTEGTNMTELERRLKLTRFLREENAENRVRMKNREEILYGSGKPLDPQELPLVYEGYLNETGYVPDAPSPARSSFRLRAALALLLLGLVVYTDEHRRTEREHIDQTAALRFHGG